ncbi:hypothetical protein H4Q26_004735 [Puccinia striiformis f. sp. tritici PST-130]|nr:hypothetical protein H4Q26_004735 [Puccinia striiformis f. sp. tritici PST-130]
MMSHDQNGLDPTSKQQTPKNTITQANGLDCQPQDGEHAEIEELVKNLRRTYRTYHLEWIEHCEAIDRLRVRLSRKKRPALTPVTTTVDISAGIPLSEAAGAIIGPGALSSSSAGITTSLTASGRTTRRTANFSTFGIGDAVTDAQFDLVLAQLGTADQKDPNIRAMKTTATVPDMALLPKDRLVSISDDENDTLVTDPISFYELSSPQTEPISSTSTSGQEHPPWTAQEQEAFEKSYATQPKQFGWIASQVKTKNRAECVIHYYRTKRENKYRNLHLPPQPVVEGKIRELRGKRSRRVPCKTPTTDAPSSSLKPKTLKSTSDAQAAGDEPDDESTEPSADQSELTPRTATAPESSLHHNNNHQDELRLNADLRRMSFDSRSIRTNHAAVTDITTATSNPLPLATNRDQPTPSFSAPSPQSIIDPSRRNLSLSSQGGAADLNGLSIRSAESNHSITAKNENHPKQSETKMQQVNPPPTPSSSHPTTANEEQPAGTTAQPSKSLPRAYKKRKLHSIDTSSIAAATSTSRPVPPTSTLDPVKVAPPPARPETRNLDILNPSSGSTNSLETSNLNVALNGRERPSAQRKAQTGTRQPRGLEVRHSNLY